MTDNRKSGIRQTGSTAMRGLVFIVAASIGLSGCAAAGALFRGGGSLAVRGAVVEGAVVRAGAVGIGTEVAAGQGLRMVAMSSRVAAAGEPVFGTAFGEMAAGRSAMVIDSAGYIRAGSRQVVRLQGRSFHLGDDVVARLRDGFIYDLNGSTPVARLRGMLPGRAIPLELGNGLHTTHARTVLVDVLEMQGGRYLVRTPAGQTGWVEAGALGLVVLSPEDERRCAGQDGILVRRSGEPIPFDACEVFGDALALETPEGRVAVSRAEVSDILYDAEAWAYRQGQAETPSSTASG